MQKDYMNSFLQILSGPGPFMLALAWAYFFIYSVRHNIPKPWGFGIVFLGVLASGQGITFQNKGFGYFWISASFIIILFGLLLNIVDIQNYVHVKDVRKTLSFVGVSLLFSLLLIPSFVTEPGLEYFQGGIQYTPFALIIGYIQRSIEEEFLFRGYLLSYLRKYEFNFQFAILFQSLVFTAFHIRRYSDNWIMLATIFLFGVLAAYLTWKSDNLIPASMMHIIVNLFLIIWLLLGSVGM